MLEVDKPIAIVKDKKYPGMYRLQWADGSISVGTTNPKPWEPGGHYGFYNLTRANDILRNYEQYVYNMEKPDPTWINKRAFLRQK